MKGSLAKQVSSYFEENGRIAQRLPQFESRPQQVEMARAVAEAFESRSRLVVEAATGTGKTLAYLVPALLSRRRTVVSTGTKALQEQLLEKDIPFLEKVLPFDFETVVLKGRRNYLCLARYQEFAARPLFLHVEDRHHWKKVEQWAETTETGDRAELASLPESWASWNDLSIGPDACPGRNCALYEECFVTKARRRAQTADLIIVNHHLFFADLALRSSTDTALLPDYDALVLDEAHNIEATALTYFSDQSSNFLFSAFVQDAEKALTAENVLSAELKAALAQLGVAYRKFFGVIAQGIERTDSRVELTVLLEGPQGELIRQAQGELDEQVSSLENALKALPGKGAGTWKLVERLADLGGVTRTITTMAEPGRIYIAEHFGRSTTLHGFPVDVGPLLSRWLYPACETQILTSATLATNGNFEFLGARIRLPKETQELILEPVFDYMNQALLYVPDELPMPADPNFVREIVPEIERLIRLCDGRAFVLFTSYRNMAAAVERLRNKLDQPVLVQGEASRSALLESFRQDPRTVLFATASFWEGVDVQGEALSLVIIDKLPFANVGDPLLKARLRHLEEQGVNTFGSYSLPSAAIMLKQGFGRLIRHRDDVGIIAVLDRRLIEKGYGSYFLASLPRARRTRSFDLVRRWWEKQRGGE